MICYIAVRMTSILKNVSESHKYVIECKKPDTLTPVKNTYSMLPLK